MDLGDNVPRSPTELYYEDPRLEISIKGKEEIIADALKEFDDNTFHNYWEYLLVLLELPVEINKYEHVHNFQDKALLILKHWVELNGEKATINRFNYFLRNHRSITSKIRKSVLAMMESS